MNSKKCTACGLAFQSRPQVKQQCYCSAPACQRERKRQWQRSKLKTDTDYRDNQTRAQQEWIKRNPDYWRHYRETHPEYVEKNRNAQRVRNTAPHSEDIVKMDVLSPALPLASGFYRISRVVDDVIAKMDAWIVEITLVSNVNAVSGAYCKEMT